MEHNNNTTITGLIISWAGSFITAASHPSYISLLPLILSSIASIVVIIKNSLDINNDVKKIHSMKKFFDFFKEFSQRLAKPTPYFFKVVGTISGAVTFITSIPGYLAEHNIVLPHQLIVLENKTVAIAGLVGTIISFLTVKDATIISTSTNLPLTNKKDKPDATNTSR